MRDPNNSFTFGTRFQSLFLAVVQQFLAAQKPNAPGTLETTFPWNLLAAHRMLEGSMLFWGQKLYQKYSTGKHLVSNRPRINLVSCGRVGWGAFSILVTPMLWSCGDPLSTHYRHKVLDRYLGENQILWRCRWLQACAGYSATRLGGRCFGLWAPSMVPWRCKWWSGTIGPLAHWPTVQPTSRIGFSDVFQCVGFIVRQLDKRILVHCALFSLCVACINMQIVLCENKCIFTLKDTWYFRWSCAVICPSLCDVCRFICTLYSVVFQVCVCARAPPEEFQDFLMLPW